MAKASKQMSTKAMPGGGAKGGNTKMFGKQGAKPMVPGQSGKPEGTGGGKFAKGGSTPMFGKGKAKPAVAGRSGKTSNG